MVCYRFCDFLRDSLDLRAHENVNMLFRNPHIFREILLFKLRACNSVVCMYVYIYVYIAIYCYIWLDSGNSANKVCYIRTKEASIIGLATYA